MSATKSTRIAQKTTHNAISTATGHEKTQTDQFCTENLKLTENVLSGPHSCAFCKVMDIIVRGFRKLYIESELLFVRLLIEEKLKFEKKKIYSIDIKTSYEMQSEAIEHH